MQVYAYLTSKIHYDVESNISFVTDDEMSRLTYYFYVTGGALESFQIRYHQLIKHHDEKYMTFIG